MSGGATQQAIDPVDRVVPAIERRDRRRRDRPDPDANEGKTPPERNGTEERPAPPSEQDDEHRIDVVVGARLLPTRQILPGRSTRPTLH